MEALKDACRVAQRMAMSADGWEKDYYALHPYVRGMVTVLLSPGYLYPGDVKDSDKTRGGCAGEFVGR